ncbi:hypothetical protein H6P81_016775 [Aristolochia fimbriata]|uniref:Uncharacterized protein n=1 Tax=Aristolochia fimbriata TaxID=158543 RepID=A0AAV7EBD8_ARIFI|nr:hypothetical protein H6P81_016775 [Aristolochia fimbriata]
MEGFPQPETRLKQKRCTPARDQNRSKVPLLSTRCCRIKLSTTQSFRFPETVPLYHRSTASQSRGSLSAVEEFRRPSGKDWKWSSSRLRDRVEPGWARVRRENLNPN